MGDAGMKRDLTFVKPGGTLAESLGVTEETGARASRVINAVIERRGSIRDVIEGLNELGLTDAEWTAAVWGFGYWCAHCDYWTTGCFFIGGQQP